MLLADLPLAVMAIEAGAEVVVEDMCLEVEAEAGTGDTTAEAGIAADLLRGRWAVQPVEWATTRA